MADRNSPARRAADDRTKDAKRALDTQRSETERQTQEQLARSESSTPTPTQAEADAIKLGLLHPDEKRSDGSEPVAGTTESGYIRTDLSQSTDPRLSAPAGGSQSGGSKEPPKSGESK